LSRPQSLPPTEGEEGDGFCHLQLRKEGRTAKGTEAAAGRVEVSFLPPFSDVGRKARPFSRRRSRRRGGVVRDDVVIWQAADEDVNGPFSPASFSSWAFLVVVPPICMRRRRKGRALIP